MLVHKKTQNIVLRLSDPQKVLSVIPTAKKFLLRGEEFVAVPHRLEEVRVLRNLNIDAPGPITSYYKWRGVHPPYAHQEHTADFLTLNPYAFCLNDMGCVDADTEYLSPAGWKKISEYEGGDVGQYHPDTGEVSFVAPTEYVKLPCDEMLRVKTKYGVDQLLSPEHRVLLAERGGSRQETVQAATLAGRHDAWLSGRPEKKAVGRIGWSKAAIPAAFSAPGGVGLALSDAEMRVQIAVIADGHFPNTTNSCVVRLKKTRKIERLAALLDSAGIQYKCRPCPPEGFVKFTFRAPRHEKEFGADWWDCSVAQLRIVTDEVMRWDGSVSVSKPTQRFSSSVKSTADFVQFAYAGTGRVARITQAERRGKTEYQVLVRADGEPLQLCSQGEAGRHQVIRAEASTDGYKYCFMVPTTYLAFRRNGCVFMSGNTGKTLSVLWAFDYLLEQDLADIMIVVCPLSTMDRTWADEIFRNFANMTSVAVHGTASQRIRRLQGDYKVYIINHDGLKNAEVLEEMRKLMASKRTVLVVDELAAFRNTKTQRWAAARKVCSLARYVWGLTGTPIPNEPTDAFGQIRLINPNAVGGSYLKFRESVMRKVTEFKWVAQPNALDTVYSVMKPAIRYARDDCIDLPPTTFVSRTAELTPEQAKAYKEMMADLIANVGDGQITAFNEAAKVMKLVQICCGSAYSGDTSVNLPFGPRLSVVMEAIENAGGKVIVFVPFTNALDKVRDALSQEYHVAVVNGATSKAERDRIFHEFQNIRRKEVLVANASAMSHGVTLTAADVIIWFAPINSAETYAQANARIVRPGQKRPTLIVNVSGTVVEDRMYARLQGKISNQERLLDMF